jgi:hypothetical protein
MKLYDHQSISLKFQTDNSSIGNIMFDSLSQAFWTEASVSLTISQLTENGEHYARGKIVIEHESVCRAGGTSFIYYSCRHQQLLNRWNYKPAKI